MSNCNRLTTVALAIGVALTIFAAAPASAQLRGNFDEADANHDGKVTFQEFAAYALKMLMNVNGPIAQRFKGMSAERQTKIIKQRFDDADSDNKGYLTRKDWNDE